MLHTLFTNNAAQIEDKWQQKKDFKKQGAYSSL
jgi:hypothetical protein